MQRALASAESAVLPLCGAGLCYARSGRSIIDKADISIDAADGVVMLLGPNGAGKSVLVRLLAGLLQPDSGTVSWGRQKPHGALMPRIGFVFQRPVLLRRSVLANIEFALAACGVQRDQRCNRAQAALARSGLAHLSGMDALVLSGGEQQRLALARTMACEPDIYVLDEPSANLDPASTAAIEAAVDDMRQAGTPVLMITHDIAQARRLADSVIFLNHGRILERTPAKDFFARPQTAEALKYINGEIVL